MSDRAWAWFAALMAGAFLWAVIIVSVIAVVRGIR